MDHTITTIAGGVWHTIGLEDDGTVVAVGSNNGGELEVSSWTDIKAVAGGNHFTIGLKEDGSAVSVGNYGFPQDVSSWTDIKAVAAGWNHTIGLKEDGTVVAVGDNYWGQQNGLSSWTNIQAVAADKSHTVGLKEDGTVVAVGGDNYYGQLNVSSWTNITAIAAGSAHTVGLKEDGTVVYAGAPWSGVPDFTSWTGIKAIAAGAYHVVGLREDGTVVAWGGNGDGQLNVSSWTGIVAIAAGAYHTIGLKADGTVVAVGNNQAYQLWVSGWSNIGQPICLDAPVTSIAFGAAMVGGAATKSLLISNTGVEELLISFVGITGTDADQFSQTNNCASVVPGASCVISVTFAPASSGAKIAMLTISSNDPENPELNIELSGTAYEQLDISTTSLPDGILDSGYDQTLIATGGLPPYTWQLTSGALPPGLALNESTAGISGAASSAGAFTFTVSATDANGFVAERPLSLKIMCVIDASSDSYGVIAPAGTVFVNDGGSQTFGIVPDVGHHVLDVLVDNTSVGAVTSYVFNDVTVNHSIFASFAPNQFALTITKSGVGSGTVSSFPAGIGCGTACSSFFDYPDEVTLIAVSDSDSFFDGWGGGECSGTGTCVATMDGDKNISASFSQYITVTEPDGGEIWTGSSRYDIRWNYVGDPGAAVRIELLKNGILNETIVSSTSIGNNGSGLYNWRVPTKQELGSDYAIRITSTTNNDYKDVSSTTFSIQ